MNNSWNLIPLGKSESQCRVHLRGIPSRRSWGIFSALANQSLAKGHHRRNDTQALPARHVSSSQGVPSRQGRVDAGDWKSGSPRLEVVRQRDKGAALMEFATSSFRFYLYAESMKLW